MSDIKEFISNGFVLKKKLFSNEEINKLNQYFEKEMISNEVLTDLDKRGYSDSYIIQKEYLTNLMSKNKC